MTMYLIQIINPNNLIWENWCFDPTTLPEPTIVSGNDEHSARCEAFNLFGPGDTPVSFSELPDNHPLLLCNHTNCIEISPHPQ